MKRSSCRGCGSDRLSLIHDFGDQPLAGEFPLIPESIKKAKRYALDLTQCGSCGLLQVCSVPPIDEIFHDNYRYSSSTIPSLVRHFDELSTWISSRLVPGASVLEFGCNDGVLLEKLAKQGFLCKGVDASANIANLAIKKGLNVDSDFFGQDYVRRNSFEKKFDLITCSNVYAHIDKLSEVTIAAHAALKDDGAFVIEVHDGQAILTEGQFDTVYHEHLSYFTVDAISYHLESHGFKVLEVERTGMHGGGLRILSNPVSVTIQEKTVSSLSSPYLNGHKIVEDISAAKSNVSRLKHLHNNLWGYGAAGRSQMFLNFTGTSNLFESIFDDSALRQGRFIIGSDLPILEFEKKKHNGACVVLAWNYADDISKQILPFFDSVYTVLPVLKKWT